jgi:sec-independent protein translocase protein TatC
MTFREHIEELKRRAKVVFLSLVTLFLVFVAVPTDLRKFFDTQGNYVSLISFFLARIRQDILPDNWILIANKLNEPLEVFLIASLVLALTFNMPIFAYEVFKYVDPALKPEEKRMVYPFVISSSTFFALGSLFGYFFIARFLIIALSPFFIASQASPYVDVSDFFFVVFLTIFLSGVAFTIPVFIFLLIRFNILDASFFSRNRIIIWVAIFIFTAFVTPDGGALLNLVLFLPLVAMIEASVFFAARHRNGVNEKVDVAKIQGCKYCSSELKESAPFCPNCGRSNA